MVRLGLGFLNEVEVPTYDGRLFAAAGIFVRAHQSVQAAIILTERGLIGDARSILRTVTECAIALNALANDSNFGSTLASAGHANSLKLIKMLLDSPSIRAELQPNDIARVEAARAELIAIPEEQRRPIIWANVAAKHCPHLYDTMYRIFSLDGVHVSIGSLARAFEMDENQQITHMKVGPDTDGLVATLNMACAAYLHAIEPIVRLYPLTGYSERVNEFTERFKSIPTSKIEW